MIKKIKSLKLHQIMFIASAVMQTVLMIINTINGNVHVDEAMTILNARSLVDNGTDILGERLPIYFDTWLHGGQSPIATYIMALFIRVFGYSLFVSRLPMLIAGIIGLWVFYLFIKELVPQNQSLINLIFTFACFSPVIIFSSSFTLDCNYLPYMLLTGMYFLTRAINTSKSRYYIISMVFFGLGFYCYILSALIIPIILSVLYIMLIIKKKISLKNIILSVIVIFFTALPFILSGLVQFGIIDDFTFLGFSISKMQHYSRSFNNADSMIINLFAGFVPLLIPDYYIGRMFISSFLYTSFIGGFLLINGVIFLFAAKSKGMKKDVENSLIFIIPSLISAAITCALTFYPTALYRYNSYNYIFIILVGFGAYYLRTIFKKINLKKFMCVFLTFSMCMFVYNWSANFSQNKITNYRMYINSYENALEFTDELDCKQVALCFADYKVPGYPGQYNERNLIALRYHYYGDNSFLSLEDELLNFGYFEKGLDIKENVPITDDGRFYYKPINKNKAIDDECLILFNEQLKIIKYDSNTYNKKDFGAYIVLYK